MKLSSLIISIGCIFGAYLVYVYLLRNKRSYYTTPGGQWVLKWNQPTGTAPFSYQYTIKDETGAQIVSAATPNTTLVLDPTLFVAPPVAGQFMSDKRYTAVLTPTNVAG